MVDLPLSDKGRQSVSVAVATALVHLVVWWQPAQASWYCHVDVNGTRVVSGRRMASGAPLVPQSAINGTLGVRPLTEADHANDPGRQAWGNTHVVSFIPS